MKSLPRLLLMKPSQAFTDEEPGFYWFSFKPSPAFTDEEPSPAFTDEEPSQAFTDEAFPGFYWWRARLLLIWF